MFEEMDNQIKQMQDDISRMCWYMRGSISWTEAHNMSFSERKIIGKVIEDNIDTVKKTKLPLL